MYKYVYIYICIYAYAYVYVYIYMDLSMYIYICICIHTHLLIGVSKAISEGIHDRNVIPQTIMLKMPIVVVFIFS
jgi:hypothetical protein